MKALGRTRRAESKRSKSPGSFWTGYFLQSLNPPPFSSSTTCVVLHQNPNHSQCCLSGVLLLSQQPTHAAYYASRCLFLAVSPSLSLSLSLSSRLMLSPSLSLSLSFKASSGFDLSLWPFSQASVVWWDLWTWHCKCYNTHTVTHKLIADVL